MVLPQLSLGETVENHIYSQSGQPVICSRFEEVLSVSIIASCSLLSVLSVNCPQKDVVSRSHGIKSVCFISFTA
jgi:hypothetical protein